MAIALRGTLPPHTPSGLASYSSTTVSYASGSQERNHVAHRGILFSWQADPEAVAALLPRPLEPADASGTVLLLAGETQSLGSEDFVRRAPPHLLGWHEARFLIPCRLGDLRGSFVWVVYKDIDYDAGIELGLYQGLVTKGARFSKSFPFRGQPLNRELRPGAVARVLVDRFEQRLLDGSFKAAGEAERVAPPELALQFGVRFMPDWGEPGGPALVHDLVAWEAEGLAVSAAWAGEARLELLESEDDEVSLLAPRTMLESRWVELDYSVGPGTCRKVHDYLDEGPGAMGPHLQGVSPPFSPTGNTAFVKSTPMGSRPGQAGHMGILAFFRVKRENAEALLPPPLEPLPETEIVSVFLNQAQSGLNRHMPEGDDSLDFLATLNPRHVNWHEAFVKIPASYRGRKVHLFTFLHVDADFKIVQGIYNGFVAKLANFKTLYPQEGHPRNEEPWVARAAVARHDQRLITLDFEAEREATEEERRSIVDWSTWTRNLGIRAFPDYANPGARPLVHQLVMWDMAAGEYARAWRGRGRISFGGSEYDELELLQPLEMLESFFVHYQYRSRPGLLEVLHDYVADPLPGMP